jgi:predicted ATPase
MPIDSTRYLPPSEAQKRYNTMLIKLLKLASTEKPLVLLLDDMQFADAASLSLIESLVIQGAVVLVFSLYL